MIQSFNGSMLYLQKKIVDFNISDCTNCTFSEQNSLTSIQLLLIILFIIIVIIINNIIYELCK